MSEADRDRLRALQDKWLALPVMVNHIRNHGGHERIAGRESPTFDDARRLLLPEWEQWFRDFFT